MDDSDEAESRWGGNDEVRLVLLLLLLLLVLMMLLVVLWLEPCDSDFLPLNRGDMIMARVPLELRNIFDRFRSNDSVVSPNASFHLLLDNCVRSGEAISVVNTKLITIFRNRR